MHKVATFLLGSLALATVAVAGSATVPAKGERPPVAAALPESLDAYYPPKAAQPVHLFGMLKLDTAFSGMAADILGGNLPGARELFRQFKAQYVDLAKLVPEWRQHYPSGPVEELGVALGTDDVKRIMGAYGEVGKLCHECHTATMVLAQQRYRWRDFAGLRVTDPLTREAVDYSTFKKILSASFAGITVNALRGQPESAAKQLEGFKARFETLKGTCQSCHDATPRYYVDGDVDEMVRELGQALGNVSASPDAVKELVQGVGRESCSKCHLLHVPAAFARKP